MRHILINYDYSLYPFTTASYLEMALRRRTDVTVYRRGDTYPDKLDLVLNIEPVGEYISIPGVKNFYYEIDNHVILGHEKWFYEQADIVLLAQMNFAPFYEGYHIEELALAADPDLHTPFYGILEEYDVGFIGNDTYPERRKLLEQIGLNFKLLRTTSDPGIPYSKKLAQCKIIFNCAMNNDINMRVFEGISCEKILFTDRIPGLDKFFVEDEHYVGYTGWKELKEKLTYYLDRGCYRRTIARQGRAHLLKNHTYDHRISDIIRLLDKS